MENINPGGIDPQTYPPLIDPFGRQLDYLRIGLTDRCNLRCRYCMPAEGLALNTHDQILSLEEIHRLVSLLSRMGIKKIRITGGEPMVRRDAIRFIHKLSELPRIEQIHLTTNGLWTREQQDAIESLPLSGINFSLDSLQADRFLRITRRDEFATVWRVIQRFFERDIPIKINSVIQKGINDDEILTLAALARQRNIQVRFIEQMPFNGSLESDSIMSAGAIKAVLTDAFGVMRSVPDQASTASVYQPLGFVGTLGIIAGYSRTFCGSCNRLRLTPEGQIKTCLYDNGVLDLRKMCRQGKGDDAIARQLYECVGKRAKDGFEAEKRKGARNPVSMARIGG